MKKLLLTIFFLLWAASAFGASAIVLPTAYVEHTFGDDSRTYQTGEITTWEALTDVDLASVTTTDQDSSGNTLYVTATTVFEGCTANVSKVIVDGQTLTITAVNSGVSLSVSSITGTIASGTAVSCGFGLRCYPDSATYADYGIVIGGETNATATRFRFIIGDTRGTEATGVRFLILVFHV